MRLGVGHTLSKAGYEMAIHEDGTSGLKALGNNRFDLIISDLRLPDIDGMEVLKQAKTIQADVGVIIITAYPQVDSAVSAIKHGAYDYISKPFSNDELLMVVGNPTALTEQEDSKQLLFESWGFTVSLIDQKRLALEALAMGR